LKKYFPIISNRFILAKLLVLIAIFQCANKLTAQTSEKDKKVIDSLKYVIAYTTNDTIKVNSYAAWDDLIFLSDPELDLELNQKIARICETYLNKKPKDKNELFYKQEYAYSCNNMAIFYENNGHYPIALKFHLKSLELQKELKNKKGIGNSYNNLGILSFDMGEIDKATGYYDRALEIRREVKDSFGLGSTLNNQGLIYQQNQDFEEALNNFNEALEIFKNLINFKGIAMIEYNVGTTMMMMKEYDSAETHLLEALEINKKISFKSRISASYSQLAYIELERGDMMKEKNLGQAKIHFNQAKDYATKALQIAEEIESLVDVINAAQQLYWTQKEIGEFEEALTTFELLASSKDSLVKIKDSQRMLGEKFEFEYEKKIEQDSIKIAEEKKVTEARLEKEKTQRFALYGGIIILIFFGGFIFNRFRKSQKQKLIIEDQKKLVEEKNTEIIDSIKYAKRIQAAILPPAKIIEKYLPNSFILYLPKDVVAGDFYWLQHTKEEVLFAAADCTGHGVPGAMVSVVCNNALNRSVKEFGLRNPGKILDQTRKIIIDEFSKAEENVNDGMDISLCSIETKRTAKGATILKYAGAHNPLWIIRKTSNAENTADLTSRTGFKVETYGDYSLIEVKADKQPVGNFDFQKPFSTHELELLEDDTIYLFSDGFADQFGGVKGKKFRPKALKELLLSTQQYALKEQGEKIHDAFENWRGTHDQVDDVCLIGVKI
jgi:serine phosphatase RsbU (regulator of sigma subunit)/Tfp pilus assembly protein PilF